MKKFIFIPTFKEASLIFPDVKFNFWKYNIQIADMGNIKIIITGIGKSNTAYTSSIIFENFNIKEAFLMGIAGTYRNSGLNVGDVVSVSTDYFVDEAMKVENSLKLTSEIGFPVIKNNLVNFECLKNIRNVKANTVSFLSSEDELANLYYNKTKALIETMEGASFGLVASNMNIRAYQIRAISNFCGDRNKQSWNIKLSINSLKNIIKNI